MKLKPCPFCGSQGELFRPVHENAGYYVECRRCHASSGVVLFGKDDAEAVAVSNWNERKLEAAVGNLRVLCIRIARQKDQEKKEELLGHAMCIAIEAGCGPTILREYTEQSE